MARARILIADDQPLFVEGLRSVLGELFDVVGLAYDGREVVDQARRLSPEAVLLDVAMPLLTGIEAARQIRAALPSTKLLFVTELSDQNCVHAAFQLGASAYVLKQALPEEVISALSKVLAGERYLSRALDPQFPKDRPKRSRVLAGCSDSHLSPRQREVLQLIAEGKSNKEVGALLKISVKTVEFHKAAIMEELGVRSTAELTRYAIQHGIA